MWKVNHLKPKDFDNSMWMYLNLKVFSAFWRIYNRYGNKVEYFAINQNGRSQSITNAKKIIKSFAFSGFIPMFASIFTTHRSIFWKGKISFMKIKDGMKVRGMMQNRILWFYQISVLQKICPSFFSFLNLTNKSLLSTSWLVVK